MNFCTHCGARWSNPSAPWPRTCEPPGCGKTTWKNLIPVAVVVVPIQGSPGRVLTVRRSIQPALGKLALVSGFMEAPNSITGGEDYWKEEAAREVLEETGLVISPQDFTLTGVASAPNNPSVLLIFMQAPPVKEEDLQVFRPNAEVSELVLVSLEDDLESLIPWSTHREALKSYLLSQQPRDWKDLLNRKTDYENALRQVEKDMRAVASKVLLESFQKGKWKVSPSSYNPGLVPIDKEAEDALEEILSRALKLGYHDRFTVEDGEVEIQGAVNDGDLTLSLVTGMKPSAPALLEDLKRLHLDFDLTAWIQRETWSALVYAKRDLGSARGRVENLEKILADLPPPGSDEEGE